MIKTEKTTRNYGIDLFKIFSMVMIVILHVIRHGGVQKALEGNLVAYEAVQVVWVFTICAVNCFALASGYVQGNIKHRYTRIVSLHLRALFYSVIIGVTVYIATRGAIGKTVLMEAGFPVISNTYWYYTEYFGLFFFMPFLNEMIEKFDKKTMTKIIVTMMVLFSLVPFISKPVIFSLNMGGSFLWLCTMYVLGAYLKKYDILKHISAKKAAGFLLGAAFVSWISRPILWYGCFLIFGTKSEYCDWLTLAYNSPTAIISAVAYLTLFSKINVKKDSLRKWISNLAASSFSVYLIHEHPLVRELIIKERFVFLADYPMILTVIGVIISALVINIICYLIDGIRDWIFRATNVTAYCQKIAKRVAAYIRTIAYKNGKVE